MPEKFNIIFDTNNLQEFGRRVKELVRNYVNSLNKPVQFEEKLIYNDIPSIEIKPKSIIDNDKNKTQEEKRPKNIGRFSNFATNKEPKMIGDGGEI